MELTYVEKERIMVQRVKTEDMELFTEIRYDLRCPIRKMMAEGAHPFAYMDLNRFNIKQARKDLAKLNAVIDKNRKRIPLYKRKYRINISKVEFHEYSKSYGYTRLMCTPYTFEGEISKSPLHLHFMTDLSNEFFNSNGQIFYGVDGQILRAIANVWSRKSQESPVVGWTFTFQNIDGELKLYKADTTLRPDEYGIATTVYKDKSLIEWEQQRETHIKNYRWLQNNLPDMCPKSLSGFSRMKNSNSKNYQKIVAEAAKLGKEL